MKISVVLPVFNEADNILNTLARLRAATPQTAPEIIVVDGGSTDGTAAAAALADKFIVAGRGRARQMHTGALASTGDVLLFLHADTRLPDRWLALLTFAFSGSARRPWAAFPVSFDQGRRVYRWIERAAAWRFKLTGVPQGDQAVAVRREAYFAVGGFPDVPLMEEYYLAGKLKKIAPVFLLSSPVVTSARRYEKNGPLRNALRNSLLVGLFHIGVPPSTLARLYR